MDAAALAAREHNGFFLKNSRSGGDLARLALEFDIRAARVPVFALDADGGALVVERRGRRSGISWMAPRWSFETEKRSEEDQRPFPRHVLFRLSLSAADRA